MRLWSRRRVLESGLAGTAAALGPWAGLFGRFELTAFKQS